MNIDEENPLYNGLVTFFSFILFGLIPMLPYVIGIFINEALLSIRIRKRVLCFR